jgi:uncharacterized protein
MTETIKQRAARLDWAHMRESLNERGYATTPPILSGSECAELAGLYDEGGRFRSRIEMERFRFGIGEYKYFAAPIPPLVAEMRAQLYTHVAPIANEWAKVMRLAARYPPDLDAFIATCHRNSQGKPTPLLLRYETGGYNCMHQDLYGDIVFPLQFTFMLSRCGSDYEGGQFLLLEQRPRAQSRCEAIVLEQGAAVVFATRYRPVSGSRGYYRANLRHGVSRIHRGRRFTLGIIFHDAK